MALPQQIAKHFREVFFGGNWTSVNLKESLEDVSLKQATTKHGDFNTIATLVFHINYYVMIITKVLEGGALEGNDKLSFDTPLFLSEKEWKDYLENCWKQAHRFSSLVEELPEKKIWENFAGEKYGNYYRNLSGVIEHTHYHLGQIVLLKKIFKKEKEYDKENDIDC
jgi:uncharacterized damage-inducible protein DinB